MALLKRFTAAVALLLSKTLYSLQANAQEQEGARFIYPDEEGLHFYDGIDVIVRYECPVEVMDLRMWCRRPDDNDWIDEVTLVENVECSEGQYKLRIDFGYESSSCWFHLSEKEEGSEIGANSFSFELSPNGPAETTFGLEEPTETTSETTPPPIATATSPTETTTTEAAASESAEPDASSDNSGLSTGVKAGIGVGVSLGVLGIVSLVAAFWLVRRRKKRDEGGSPVERQELDSGGVASEIKYTYHKDTVQAPPSELMDTSAQRNSHAELPG